MRGRPSAAPAAAVAALGRLAAEGSSDPMAAIAEGSPCRAWSAGIAEILDPF